MLLVKSRRRSCWSRVRCARGRFFLFDPVVSNGGIGVHFIDDEAENEIVCCRGLAGAARSARTFLFCASATAWRGRKRMLPPDGFSMWLERHVVPSILLHVAESTGFSAVHRWQR